MLNKEIKEIISASKDRGWVLEPDAKRLFSIAGLDIPHFTRVNTAEDAIRFAKKIGYPVVCKVVSPLVIHKSERDGVAVGIMSDEEVTETFERFSGTDGFAGMLVEETLSGIELIVGAKIDYQFGPIIILGIGGVGVEIYRDIAMRMAPLAETDVELMVKCLRAHELLEGYRGSKPVNLKELGRLLARFSGLVMDLGEMIESIDLNPVICSSTKCVVADARIILKE
ncbi:MAG: acetyl-CoA synthetase [Proteobacteria bacterium]|nr:acetyl-CoA synthetase [Pseudomonadota bacterium]NIS68057.1 acetyl-CoA synthetase [Pseudomonadota bacterium]